jgi:hypothetical protein
MTKKTSNTWDDLYQLENKASFKLRKALSPFYESVKNCYELGVELPTLIPEEQQWLDISFSYLYLKRSLTDLREIWKLLLQGYTSQAATLAASAYEHALITACMAGSREMSEKLDNMDSLEFPWRVAELCQRLARQTHEEFTSQGTKVSEEKYEMWWRAVYGYYKWLCKIKHPTLTSVAYDSVQNQTLKVDWAQSLVKITPNFSEDDFPNKCFIIFVAVHLINEAIHRLGFVSGINPEDEKVKSWMNRFYPRRREVWEVYKRVVGEEHTFAIDISYSKLADEWWEYKQRDEDNSDSGKQDE